MKELEERLREKQRSGWVRPQRAYIHLDDALAIVADAQKELTLAGGSISSAPGTISFGSENLRYHRDIDTGAKTAADAPRIEPAPADWSGNIHDSPDWVEDFIRHEGVWYFSSKRFAALSNFTQRAEQIHTNSPSEGIRATPDLPDSIHQNQGKECEL